MLQYASKENLLLLSNEKEERCETLEDNSTCYFYMEVHEYLKLTEMFIYSFVDDDPSLPLEICALWIERKKFDDYSYTDDISNLLLKGDCEYLSKENVIHLIKEDLLLKPTRYLLIKVKSEHRNRITVMTNTHPMIAVHQLNRRNEEMFLLNDNRITRNGMIFKCINEAVDYKASYQIKRVHSNVNVTYENVYIIQ